MATDVEIERSASEATALRSTTPSTPNPQQFSAVIRAVAEGDLTLVIRLLDTTSIHVNTRSRGTTVLHEGSKAGHLSVVQELLSRSAEVNAVNRSGCTALHFATLCKDKERGLDVVTCLLSASAHVNVTSERMDTPLHYAAYCEPTRGAEAVIRCLLSSRAFVNARNRNSDSPLINAALNNNPAALKVLIEQRADTGQRNSIEKTVQDIARERGCTEVLQVLEEMQDPMTQLTDTTQLMRTALSHMQTVDMLSADLRRQRLLTEAYESVAAAAVAEMEDTARARLVHHALSSLQDVPAQRDRNGDFKLQPARSPLTQQMFLQTLVTLLLVSRTGSRALHHPGVLEGMPILEQQARENNMGHKELRELRASMQKSQVELLEMAADRSCSSTPSSINDPHVMMLHSIGPSTPSTTLTTASIPGMTPVRGTSSLDRGTSSEASGRSGGARSNVEGVCESPSTTSGDYDSRMPTRRPLGSNSRLSVGARVAPASQVASSSPCTIGRGSLPLIADERRVGSEDDQLDKSSSYAYSARTESFPARAESHETLPRTLIPGSEGACSNKSSPCASATLDSGIRSNESGGSRFSFWWGGGRDCGKDEAAVAHASTEPHLGAVHRIPREVDEIPAGVVPEASRHRKTRQSRKSVTCALS